MRCHYDVLGVEKDGTDEDIKKSYKKLALKYHPDKNIDNQEECAEQFRLVQQAYEILSDKQERAFYDRHYDSIIHGGFGEDNSYTDERLDIFAYFNTSCFNGFGDGEMGFYQVYGDVFTQLASEECQHSNDLDDDVPKFGLSDSDYHDVAYVFYTYWEGFVSKKSYAWMDKHDLRQAPSRFVRRKLEKENKKLRDAARKERTEEIRALVAFVKKRDKRVVAERLRREKREAEIRQRDLEKRKRKQEESKIEGENILLNNAQMLMNLEPHLANIEAEHKAEFGDDSEIDDSLPNDDDTCAQEVEYYEKLYCPVCNKSFGSMQTLESHNRSKKHKERLLFLANHFQEEEEEEESLSGKIISGEETLTDFGSANGEFDLDLSKDTEHTEKKRSKKKKKQQRKLNRVMADVESEEDIGIVENVESSHVETSLEESFNITLECSQTPTTNIDYTKDEEKGKEEKTENMFCNVCKKCFTTRNLLFKHLKDEGHALRVDNNKLKEKNGRKKQLRKM